MLNDVFVWALLGFGWAGSRQEIVCSCVESCTDVRSDGEADCAAPNAKHLVNGCALM